MAGHIYKKIEVIGSSPEGMQAAIENAITQAADTIRNMRWFEVVETRGQIENGKIAYWQVTLKIGFTIEAHDKID
jgi:flavin-binding protein dodecin